MAPNPAQMIEQHRKSALRHLRLIPITLAAGVLLEVFAPYDFKPSTIVAEAVANYKRHQALVSIGSSLTYADEAPFAGVLADRMNERASWTGLCNVA
ncbi:MAG: hypothetical protein AAFQ13_04335, partial [Pseudomonadota bacterium]